MAFWFQAGFKRHSPISFLFTHPTWFILLHVFPNPYLGFGGMPNPAVITTGSRCSPRREKVKSDFQFCECIPFRFLRILGVSYIYIYVYVCLYLQMCIYICVCFRSISITRLWFADIRRSVLHLCNSRNGLFVSGYPF